MLEYLDEKKQNLTKVFSETHDQINSCYIIVYYLYDRRLV